MNRDLKDMKLVIENSNPDFAVNPDGDENVNVFTGNLISKPYGVSYIANNGTQVCVVTEENKTSSFIVGFVDNEKLFKEETLNEELLIRAINNRTRERNYFRLYCQLLEKEMTEDEFDAEIEKNVDDYVTSANQNASQEEFQYALNVSSKIMDVKDASDMIDLFSFNDCSIHKYIK